MTRDERPALRLLAGDAHGATYRRQSSKIFVRARLHMRSQFVILSSVSPCGTKPGVPKTSKSKSRGASIRYREIRPLLMA